MSMINEAKELKDVVINHRRHIHKNAETHLDLPITSAYVIEKLKEMGYEPQVMGSSGVVAIVGGKKPGKTFLLRADMDALPIIEENDLPFRSKTENMHACGHDFHASMLLGAAQLLKNHENEINGTVKLMFQPAEETLSGAKMMVENGILENPKVDAAMMLHVNSGVPIPTGTVMIVPDGACAASADWFTIKVQGKGSHGAMPNLGVDPLNVLSHIHIALQAINAREVAPSDIAVLTIGQMHGGNTSNVIPDTAYMTGTIRTMNEKVRDLVKKRLQEIACGVGTTFGAAVTVTFDQGCACNMVDANLNQQVKSYAEKLIGKDKVLDNSKNSQAKNYASEDFAYISNVVPSAMVMLAAGTPEEGHCYPLHHPKATFNEDALPIGAAVYANTAMEWLNDN